MFNVGYPDKSRRSNVKRLVRIILIPILLTVTLLLCLCLCLYVVKNKKKKREGNESQTTLFIFCIEKLTFSKEIQIP